MAEKRIFKSLKSKYDNLEDEEVIIQIKSGDKEALEYLIEKYKDLVNMKVSRYFIIGAEKEDIFQEGLIGLFKAVKCYQSDKQNSFKTFANLCIERQLITAIKSSTRQKHMPLNGYLSLNSSAFENDDDSNNLIDVFDSGIIEDPLDTITKKEYYKMVEMQVDKALSDFEKQVLGQFVQGYSYIQIAENLDSPVKSIDNAIQRIRKKAIKSIIEDENN